jgi:hypothetical protein
LRYERPTIGSRGQILRACRHRLSLATAGCGACSSSCGREGTRPARSAVAPHVTGAPACVPASGLRAMRIRASRLDSSASFFAHRIPAQPLWFVLYTEICDPLREAVENPLSKSEAAMNKKTIHENALYPTISNVGRVKRPPKMMCSTPQGDFPQPREIAGTKLFNGCYGPPATRTWHTRNT